MQNTLVGHISRTLAARLIRDTRDGATPCELRQLSNLRMARLTKSACFKSRGEAWKLFRALKNSMTQIHVYQSLPAPNGYGKKIESPICKLVKRQLRSIAWASPNSAVTGVDHRQFRTRKQHEAAQSQAVDFTKKTLLRITRR